MTYYEILEISENASQEVIHMAYKALCKKYHPDVYQGDKSYAEEQMKKINEAYMVLSDAKKKKQYDDSIKNNKQSRYRTYSEQKQEHKGTNIDALLKRGFMSLEDGEWLKADNFFEQVLNQDAEIAEAHLGKLMIELNARTKDELKNCYYPFDDKSSYQRAIRFADDTLKNFLLSTIQFINRRNYEAECNNTYSEACKYLNRDADGVWHIEKAISLFEKIPNYKDSSIKIQECEEKIRTIKENISKQNLIDIEKRKKTTKLVTMIGIPTIFVLVITIIIISAITKSNAYNRGLKLIESGEYIEAIAVLEKIDDYKDTDEMIQKARYLFAKKLFDENNFEKAKEEFLKTSYNDSSEYIKLCNEKIDELNYQKVLSLIKEDKILEAYDLLKELSAKNYKDTKSLVNEYKSSYETALFKHNLKTSAIGSVVKFGSYEQDDNFDNGKEAVEWIIIDRNQESTMLISKNIIEYQPYLNVGWGNYRDTTWETCTLRTWLNTTFYNSLFSAKEKQYVKSSSVVPDPKEYSTSVDPGNKTVDNVYLLSEKEYNKYKSIAGVSECGSSRYVLSKERHGYNRWWLRSPHNDYLIFAKEVYSADYITTETVDHDNGVRPVVWINFK